MYRHHPSWVAAMEVVSSGGSAGCARSRAGSRTTTTIRRTSGTSSRPVAGRCSTSAATRSTCRAYCSLPSPARSRPRRSAIRERRGHADRRSSSSTTARDRPPARPGSRPTSASTSTAATGGCRSIPFNIPPDRPTHVFVTADGDPPVASATETLTFPTKDPYTAEAEALRGRHPGRPADPDPARTRSPTCASSSGSSRPGTAGRRDHATTRRPAGRRPTARLRDARR